MIEVLKKPLSFTRPSHLLFSHPQTRVRRYTGLFGSLHLLRFVRLSTLLHYTSVKTRQVFKMKCYCIPEALSLAFALSVAAQPQDIPDASRQSPSSCSDPSLLALAQSLSPCLLIIPCPSDGADHILSQLLATAFTPTSTSRTPRTNTAIRTSS